MHWLLSVPDTFSLREVIRRSGWLLYPPFHVKTLGDQLLRIEQLGGSTTVALTIYQAPAGLVLEVEPHLSGMEVEEASRRVWHMLRLDENIQPFLRSAQTHEALKSTKRMGGSLLRGADLFEHATVAALVTWAPNGMPQFEQVAGLSNRLGSALPRNPTLHSFPTPDRILTRVQTLSDMLAPDTVERIARISQAFTTKPARIELLARQPINADELAGRLAEELLLDEPGVGLLMLYIGRYDYVPTDSVAQARVGEFRQRSSPASRQEIVALFDRWHPWGGLAYWLWDWSKVPVETPDPAAR